MRIYLCLEAISTKMIYVHVAVRCSICYHTFLISYDGVKRDKNIEHYVMEAK